MEGLDVYLHYQLMLRKRISFAWVHATSNSSASEVLRHLCRVLRKLVGDLVEE